MDVLSLMHCRGRAAIACLGRSGRRWAAQALPAQMLSVRWKNCQGTCLLRLGHPTAQALPDRSAAHVYRKARRQLLQISHLICDVLIKKKGEVTRVPDKTSSFKGFQPQCLQIFADVMAIHFLKTLIVLLNFITSLSKTYSGTPFAVCGDWMMSLHKLVSALHKAVFQNVFQSIKNA